MRKTILFLAFLFHISSPSLQAQNLSESRLQISYDDIYSQLKSAQVIYGKTIQADDLINATKKLNEESQTQGKNFVDVKLDNCSIKGTIYLEDIAIKLNDSYQMIVKNNLVFNNSTVDSIINTKQVFPWWCDTKIYPKTMSLNDICFNNVILQGTLDLSKTYFIGKSTFSNSTFISDVTFSDSVFVNNAQFDDTKFLANADFFGASFQDKASFFQTNFEAKAFFNFVMFLKKVSFIKTMFTEQVLFYETTFFDESNFNEADFKNKASFSSALFYKETCFSGAVFSKEADFFDAIFYGRANFDIAHFCKNASFYSVMFKGSAIFSGVYEGEVNFTGATFSRNASFGWVTFPDRVSFHHCKFLFTSKFDKVSFKKEVSFGNAYFADDTIFTGSRFSGETSFHEAKFLGDADFSHATFSGYKTLFVKSSFNGKQVSFDDSNFDSYTFFDEMSINSKISFKKCFFNILSLDWTSIKALKIGVRYQYRLTYDEQFYSQLIKSLIEKGLYDDADEAYYEFRHRRRTEGNVKELGFLSRSAEFFFDYFCAYGTKPLRILICWGIVIAFSTLIFSSKKAFIAYPTTDTWTKRFSYALFFSLNIFTTLGYGGKEISENSLSLSPYNIYKKIIDSLIWLLPSKCRHKLKHSIPNNVHKFSKFKLSISYRLIAMLIGLTGWFLMSFFLVMLGRKFIR